MDALHISGKWYISSRRAAKEHGYHVDYIGQLIRTGKVKGQKVGRAWYVLADSLSDYLEKEGNAPSPKSSAMRAKALTRSAAKEKPVAVKVSPKTPPPEIEEEEQDEIVEAKEVAPEISAPAPPPEPAPIPEPAPEPLPAPEAEELPLETFEGQAEKDGGLLTYLRDDEPIVPLDPILAETADEGEKETRIPIHAAVKRFTAVVAPLKARPVQKPMPPVSEYRRIESAPSSYSPAPRRVSRLPLLLLGAVAFGVTLLLSLSIASTVSL